MHISALRIENFKSFLSSGDIRFAQGFNVVVGKNNVGKTALIEAASLRLENKPHRSLKTAPRPNTQLNLTSRVHITFELDAKELHELILDGFSEFYVPAKSNEAIGTQAQRVKTILSNQNTLACTYEPGNFTGAEILAFREIPDTGAALRYTIERPNMVINPPDAIVNRDRRGTLPYPLASMLRERIYIFSAERMIIGECMFGSNRILAPNARNLAEVLNILQGDRIRFDRFNQFATTIFPDIKEITVEPVPTDKVRVRVATLEPSYERVDLAMPLSECGTGVGQVLAMLYVAIDSAYPRIIIIDEPQSFLHPGAVRKLFEILMQYPQHQYIITTHSPTAVTAAETRSLLLVRKPDAESTIENVEVEDANKLRLYLAEVGARLSDVFGADNILWVEGQTEEQCIPLILSRAAKKPLLGTVILSVLQTGDLKGKDRKRVFEIYTRLSEGKGLLPPATGFVFDQEGLTATEQEDLERDSKNTVHFIPRRMYENYLLNTRAIASLMSSIEGFRDDGVGVEEVEKWLHENKWNRKYFGNEVPEEKRTEQFWLQKVDGAKLLVDMFSKLSETRVDYNSHKVEYGVALTNWLIENSPDDLKELADFVVRVLEQGRSET